MAYSADTFVADEQPTTAKWNKLWSNDASFNDGSGILDTAVFKNVAVGSFTVTGTGNVSVSSLDFTPKYVEFDYLTNVTSNNRDGRGCMTANAQYAISAATSSGPNSTTTVATNNCLIAISGGGTTFLIMSYVSLNSNGFTVNVGTYASGPHAVGYKAFG